MNELLEFIITNKRLIIDLILVIVSVLFFILRKPSKNTIYDSSFYSKLVTLILEAESLYPQGGHGDEKMKYVLEKYCKFMNLSIDDTWSVSLIRAAIERLLSVPQKKEK